MTNLNTASIKRDEVDTLPKGNPVLMPRPIVALHITTRLFREALSRALDPHVDVVIVPDSPDEQRTWFAAQAPVDLAIVSGVDGGSEVDAPVVVEVAPADGRPVGRVNGTPGRTVRTLDELLALLEDEDGAAGAT